MPQLVQDAAFRVSYVNTLPTIRCVDEHIGLEGMPPAAFYADEDAFERVSHFYDGLSIDAGDADLNERIAVLASPLTDLRDSTKPIVFKWMSMLDLHALREGKLKNRPVGAAVCGVTVSTDEQFMMASRGGPFTFASMEKSLRSFDCLPPTGQLTWVNDGDTIIDQTARRECVEELGLFEIIRSTVFGVSVIDGPVMPGVKFGVRLQLRAESQDIIECHNQALRLLDAQRESGVADIEVLRRALEAEDLPIDAWELSKMWCVEHNLERVRAVLMAQEQSMIPPSWNTLRLYFEYLEQHLTDWL